MASLTAAQPEVMAHLRDAFSLMEDWEERYAYVIDLGRELPAMAPDLKTDANKVRGCASQVWLNAQVEDGRLRLTGDSDAHIVRGLVAIVTQLYNGLPIAEAAAFDPKGFFDDIGLSEALSTQRANGLAAMIARIRAIAS